MHLALRFHRTRRRRKERESASPGDQRAIAIETARRLGMGTTIYGRNIWSAGSYEDADLIARAGGLENLALEANGFAGVFPEHKFRIVEALQVESRRN